MPSDTIVPSSPTTTLTTLLHTHILALLPAASHHAYVCSAGSKGYHALKEMLQNGMPGSTMLIESGDLREVVGVVTPLSNSSSRDNNTDTSPLTTTPDDSCCSLLYSTALKATNPQHGPQFAQHLPPSVTHITIYSNQRLLYPYLLQDCTTQQLRSVDITAPNATEIPSHFLNGCARLTSLHLTLSPLSQVTLIEERFLGSCTDLKELDLSPLSGVREIRSNFLNNCTGLTSLDMSPLSHIHTLPEYFLYGCSGLTQLDLGPFSSSSSSARHITTIPVHFLGSCLGLVSLDLSPLSAVTEVHGGFLSNCKALTSLNLAPLSKLTDIPQSFLVGCSGLESLDLSALVNVTSIQEHFLAHCSGLKTLNIAPLSRHLTSIPKYFLTWCKKLEEIDLSPLSQVTYMPDGFLSGVGLTTIDLSTPWISTLTDISEDFLVNSLNLKSIDLSPMTNLERLPTAFLRGCTGLKSITLGDATTLINMWRLPESFLQGCCNLESIDLQPLSHFKEIPPSFLSGCTGLTSLDLSPLSNVTHINASFLNGCSGLKTLDMSSMTKLKEIDSPFLEGCQYYLKVIDAPPACRPPGGWAAVAGGGRGGPRQWKRCGGEPQYDGINSSTENTSSSSCVAM